MEMTLLLGLSFILLWLFKQPYKVKKVLYPGIGAALLVAYLCVHFFRN